MVNLKKNQLKRTKTGSDSDDEPCGVDSFPRFMVIQSKDATKPLTSLSPFVIEKTITGLIGSPKNVKKLKSGCLLVECQRRGQTENLKKIKTFFDIPASSIIHTTSHNIVYCWLPSHVGIKGNDKADRAAKMALSLEPFDFKTPYTDFKRSINDCLRQKWQAS
jgi:hypothetical protein